MLGPIILAVVMLIMVPLVLVTGGLLFAFVDWATQAEVEHANEGSELLDLN